MKAVTGPGGRGYWCAVQNEGTCETAQRRCGRPTKNWRKNVRIRTQELEDTVAALRNEILVRKKIQAELHHLSRQEPGTLEADRRTVARSCTTAFAAAAWLPSKLEPGRGRRAGARERLRGRIAGDPRFHLADTIKETKRIAANLRPLAIYDIGLWPRSSVHPTVLPAVRKHSVIRQIEG